MTKEEKIKEVYEGLGFKWSQVSYLVTDNGVLVLPSPSYKYILEGYDNLVSEGGHYVSFGKDGLKLQPNALRGIYNNNGWISLKSEDDLPKEPYGSYHVITDSNMYTTEPPNQGMEEYWLGDITKKSWWLENVLCYQPIGKPEPNLYL